LNQEEELEEDEADEEADGGEGAKNKKRKREPKLTMDNLPQWRLHGNHPLVAGEGDTYCDCPAAAKHTIRRKGPSRQAKGRQCQEGLPASP
jgi:hypothetical protein